jgi:hypothetical protein
LTKLVALVVGITLAAGTAFADAKKRRHQNTSAVTEQQAKPAPRYRGLNLFPPGPVYHSNEYLGDDPDPFIRQQLLRDLGAHYGPPD